jgi:hypothetical protein
MSRRTLLYDSTKLNGCATAIGYIYRLGKQIARSSVGIVREQARQPHRLSMPPLFDALTKCRNSHRSILLQAPRGWHGGPSKPDGFFAAELTADCTLFTKLFRISTYRKRRAGGELLTRIACRKLAASHFPDPVPCPAGHCSTGHTVPQSPQWRKQFRRSRCLRQ